MLPINYPNPNNNLQSSRQSQQETSSTLNSSINPNNPPRIGSRINTGRLINNLQSNQNNNPSIEQHNNPEIKKEKSPPESFFYTYRAPNNTNNTNNNPSQQMHSVIKSEQKSQENMYNPYSLEKTNLPDQSPLSGRKRTLHDRHIDGQALRGENSSLQAHQVRREILRDLLIQQRLNTMNSGLHVFNGPLSQNNHTLNDRVSVNHLATLNNNLQNKSENKNVSADIPNINSLLHNKYHIDPKLIQNTSTEPRFNQQTLYSTNNKILQIKADIKEYTNQEAICKQSIMELEVTLERVKENLKNHKILKQNLIASNSANETQLTQLDSTDTELNTTLNNTMKSIIEKYKQSNLLCKKIELSNNALASLMEGADNH